jgi:BirA family transcriptional regulator, biotin operon repressor / biotin---[acetyl-CoA-carboxylase] ligase
VPVTDGPSPDLDPRPPLDADRLVAAASYDVHVVAEADSTNVLVAARAQAGAAEGEVVVAEHQVAGRGRLARRWETPGRAALTFSVLLRPTAPPAQWPWLPLLTGVAVVRVLRSREIPADLKWPNDVFLDDAKVAGILVERIETPRGPAAVIGVGLNVSTTRAELPVETATSLRLAGHEADRTGLLLDLLATLRQEYDAWLGGAGAALRAAYVEMCTTARAPQVRVELPDGEVVVGRGVGIGIDGCLELQTPAGPRTIGAGDVVHVRAAE